VILTPSIFKDSRSGQLGRTIIIGDVHGCHSELMQLLQAAEVKESDRIVSVGDLISKGPDSLAVMKWAMNAPNLRCVLGNHEARLLDRWRSGVSPDPGTYDAEICRQLGDSYEESMQFINTWPLYHEDGGALIVHAGIDPRLSSIEQQSRRDLLNIRIPEGMDNPWYEIYEGSCPIVFGHWAKHDPVVRDNAIGLDTGCVYGGALTALVLPECRLLSIPASREYQKNSSWN